MRVCAKCKKGSIIRGKRKLLRGHYNPTGKSRKYPNLQWANLPAGKAGVDGKRVKICTQCLRTLAKTEKK